jgi:ribosomal protein S18 acetylase RimI-like enzyme
MRKALDVKPYNFYHSIKQLEDKKSNIFLLLKDNDLVGSVACIENEIDDLIVNKNYQRQAYGKKLLMFAINYIQKQNSKPITLHVAKWNENAVSLYDKCGFECVHVEEIN